MNKDDDNGDNGGVENGDGCGDSSSSKEKNHQQTIKQHFK